MELQATVGENIRRLRNEKGLTMTKLAYLVGISYTHLQKIEDGKTNVGVATLFAICNALDIDLPDFFSDSYFNKTNTDQLVTAIRKLTESERISVLGVIEEINKYKIIEK